MFVYMCVNVYFVFCLNNDLNVVFRGGSHINSKSPLQLEADLGTNLMMLEADKDDKYRVRLNVTEILSHLSTSIVIQTVTKFHYIIVKFILL